MERAGGAEESIVSVRSNTLLPNPCDQMAKQAVSNMNDKTIEEIVHENKHFDIDKRKDYSVKPEKKRALMNYENGIDSTIRIKRLKDNVNIKKELEAKLQMVSQNINDLQYQ